MTDPRVTRLRAAFDAAFARPAAVDAPDVVDLLLVRAGDARLALPLDELGHLERAPVVRRVPGARPDVGGVSIVRGRLVAVFDLAALTGAGATRATDGPSFVALLRRDPTLALRFNALEGRGTLARAALPVESPTDPAGTTTVVAVGGEPRKLVGITSLLRSLVREGEGGA